MVEVAIAVTIVATPILMVVVAAIPMVVVICMANSILSALCEYTMRQRIVKMCRPLSDGGTLVQAAHWYD